MYRKCLIVGRCQSNQLWRTLDFAEILPSRYARTSASRGTLEVARDAAAAKRRT
jgi:hypothetical protein